MATCASIRTRVGNILATGNDLNFLKSDMGHEHVRVFFNHYHKAVSKAEAQAYWAVMPGSA